MTTDEGKLLVSQKTTKSHRKHRRKEPVTEGESSEGMKESLSAVDDAQPAVNDAQSAVNDAQPVRCQ